MLAVEDVSYLEAVLASPCMLSLVCFSLEVKHGNVMLEKAQHQRSRVGARGNIISIATAGYFSGTTAAGKATSAVALGRQGNCGCSEDRASDQ